MIAPLEARGAVSSGRMPGEQAAKQAAVRGLLFGLLLLGSVCPAVAAPFIWDEDQDRIDDRIESVHVLGYQVAFEHGDSLLRKRIAVARVPGSDLVYSVYVLYDRPLTSSDLNSLHALGMPVLHRYEAVPAVRSIASFAQIQTASTLNGVERVEAIPMLYPMVRTATAAIGVRDPTGQVFPTWNGTAEENGSGVVIAFLDTGINDAPDGPYPGHESLLGRCLGGALFVSGDSTLDTSPDGSINPVDHGGAFTGSHGTHVASLALGSGGASGYAVGVAPDARFVDVKVLDDTGMGTGVPEGLDWCIHNRARNWGGPAGFEGIDVINLSLSSLDQTDGNDLASLLADRAAELGMVVVASMGNDGTAGHVPSPAGADGVLAVGAFDDQRSPLGGDDLYASFNNYGPRADDGDSNPADEQKPDLLAPGVAILGADGDESTDGAQYKELSGTSMSAALVSGAVALLRSAHPALDPAAIAELLRATAPRALNGLPAGQSGVDPRWLSTLGFGALDLYAARLEMAQPGRSQVVRLELTGSESQITAVLRTQREMGAAHFVFERAPDQTGSPGTFVPYDSVAANGDPSLADAHNRSTYTRVWSVQGNERGSTFWYRVSYTEAGTRYDSPGRRFVSPSGASVASIELTIVHNTYDHDVNASIEVGGGSSISGQNVSPPALVFPVPGSSAAESSQWVTGASTTGNVAWTFVIPVPSGSAEAYLPPSAQNPWRLKVTEGGYINRSGRITTYRLIWHKAGGDMVFQGGPLPQQTVEGQTTSATIPQTVLGTDVRQTAIGLRFGPNPVRAGEPVLFSMVRPLARVLSITDLAGREVARVPITQFDGMFRATWKTRDGAGHPLHPGMYFARVGRGASVRLVVLER